MRPIRRHTESIMIRLLHTQIRVHLNVANIPRVTLDRSAIIIYNRGSRAAPWMHGLTQSQESWKMRVTSAVRRTTARLFSPYASIRISTEMSLRHCQADKRDCKQHGARMPTNRNRRVRRNTSLVDKVRNIGDSTSWRRAHSLFALSALSART